MSIMKKLFGDKDQYQFQMRYVSVVDEWEVLDSNGVVYVGTKENCRLFIQTCSWLKNLGTASE